jgi:CheY-like chemotaxis protein/HPt (histidine-containing phosphotransfer) domain-containing protein
LDFTSTPGSGTTFWFDLPLRTAAPPAAEPVHRSHPTDARVLVVDDNATNRKVLHQFLASWSLEPRCVPDGRSALSELRAAAEAGTPYDAAILDMHMPGMSGLDVAVAISGDPRLSGLPVAVLTSSNLQGEAAGARAAGASVFLTKPVREAQLYEGLSSLLGERAPARAAGALPAPRPRSSRRLLVAEDNAVNQQVVVAMLDALGFDADVAVDGRHAVELFGAGDYAAVLMDCQMPRLDGYAATRALRQAGGGGANVPIIALTASALAADEQRCRDAGMDDFVTKPLRPEVLARVLDRWVGADAVPAEPAPAARVAPPAPAAPAAGPLDRAALAELAALGPDLLAGVVTTFLDSTPARMAELRAAVETGDGTGIRAVAHAIKSSASYVGASALADTYALLETAEPAEAPGLLAAAEAELARVTEALGAVLAAAR